MKGSVDRLGTIASAACALHCVAGALLPSSLAALGLGAFFGHEAEWAFNGAAMTFALGALALGWRRHRSWAIAAAFGLGIVGLGAARGLEESGLHEVGLATSLASGAALVAAHVASLRADRIDDDVEAVAHHDECCEPER